MRSAAHETPVISVVIAFCLLTARVRVKVRVGGDGLLPAYG